MNRWLSLIVLLSVFVCLACGCGEGQRSSEQQGYLLGAASTPGGVLKVSAPDGSVDLIAGRTEVVGAVEWQVDGNLLYVRYVANGDWTLTKTQLVAAESLEDIPTTNHGNPRVGHFPCKGEHEPPVRECEYVLALDEWGLDDAAEVIIAAHADVLLDDGEGEAAREEGAWGDGMRFSESVVDHSGEEGKAENASEGGGNWAMYFTINITPPTATALKINEIFYCGSDAASFYFYDQFVELYNNSSSTIYLDGIIVTRQMQSFYPDQDEVPFVRALYAYQFPGTPVTGREYPVAPGQFVVIAADAVDHRQWCQKSIDLSHADWEFFNPLSSDYDNPAVPNVVNMVPSSKVDYMLNLVHNAVVIASGEAYEFDEYEPGKFLVRIPIETVIDGVEYAANTSSTKELTIRVDAGFAGIGCIRYSGQSTERQVPGVDTNHSTVDFLLALHPTPGYSHPESSTGNPTPIEELSPRR